jgi:7-carboxy-7-deazaguanine synthase
MKMNKPIDKEVCGFANELKFIVGTEQDIEEINLFLSSLTFKFDDYKVYLQPMSISPKATKICVEACKTYGYKLSLQTHKWIEEK